MLLSLIVGCVSALLHHLLLLTGLSFLTQASSDLVPRDLCLRDEYPAHLHKAQINL
jgi:hypothetical protein